MNPVKMRIQHDRGENADWFPLIPTDHHWGVFVVMDKPVHDPDWVYKRSFLTWEAAWAYARGYIVGMQQQKYGAW